MSVDVLEMWTIYRNHPEFPGRFLACCFRIRPTGPELTDRVVVADTLDQVRDALTEAGLTFFGVDPADDPTIVETWL